MDGTIVQQLIDFVKTASPLVWNILIKQVYSEAIADLIWAFGLGGTCFVFVKVALYGFEKNKDDEFSDWSYGKWLGVIFATISGIISFSLIIGAVQWFANPEFYAIRFILEKLAGQ
jgi:hypothetical protein